MIIFVDYEHASSRDTDWGREITRLRTELTYKLEDLAGEHCMLVRYDKITPELVERVDPTAIFISGNGTDPDRYTADELAPMRGLIRGGVRPVFGFCGGMQLMAQSLDVPLQSMGEVDLGAEPDPSSPFGGATVTEIGYMPVEFDVAHPLSQGLGDDPVFRHAHMHEISAVPDGFVRVARTDVCERQMIVNDAAKMVGTQFHPESWTDAHPAGARLITNFLDWVRTD